MEVLFIIAILTGIIYKFFGRKNKKENNPCSNCIMYCRWTKCKICKEEK